MNEFFIAGHRLHHPVHGTFFVDRLLATSTWEVSRVYPVAGNTRQNVVENLAAWGEPRTLAQAKRIVRKRIAELDALHAARVPAMAEVAL